MRQAFQIIDSLVNMFLDLPFRCPATTANDVFGLGHRSARRVGLWSAATRRRMVRKAVTSRRTPNLVG